MQTQSPAQWMLMGLSNSLEGHIPQILLLRNWNIFPTDCCGKTLRVKRIASDGLLGRCFAHPAYTYCSSWT